MFLQTQKDMEIFRSILIGLGFDIYLEDYINKRLKIVTNETLRFGRQYFVSKDVSSYEKHWDINKIAIEYLAPTLYRREGQTDIISYGRVWISSDAPNEMIKDFESVRKWLRKNYMHIDDFWFAPDCCEQIKEGAIIAATNCGRMQLVDENLQPLFFDTWLTKSD